MERFLLYIKCDAYEIYVTINLIQTINAMKYNYGTDKKARFGNKSLKKG